MEIVITYQGYDPARDRAICAQAARFGALATDSGCGFGERDLWFEIERKKWRAWRRSLRKTRLKVRVLKYA